MSPRQPTPEARASQLIRSVQRVNAWRDSNNPLRSLTMPTAVNWLEQAQRGIMSDLQWAYETGIEPGNADLVCIRERDEASIRDCEWTIKQIDPETRNFDQVLADEQEAFLRELYEGIENLNDACAFMASYRFRGFAHLNPWNREDDPTYIKELHPLDQWNLTRDGYRGAWKWNPEARQVGFASLPAENLLDPAEYVFLETRRPVNRIALIGHVRATTAEKDWDAYVEIYGLPGVFIIMPENTPDDKVADYLDAAEKAAEQGSGALPAGSNVVTTQEARSSQPFQPRLEWIQKQLVLAGTGGLLTMLAESGSGTLAGSVHDQAFRQIARGVSRRISQTFQQQIDKRRMAAKFPGRPVLAYFDLTAPEYRDVDKAVTNIATLAGQGYRMPAEQVTEITGLEVQDTGAPAPVVPPVSRFRARAATALASEGESAPLSKLQQIFANLESLAADPKTTDAQLAAAVEKAAAQFPELLPDLTAAIARPLALDMAKAAVEGASEEEIEAQTQEGSIVLARNARALCFDPNQPRDENGQWSDTPGGGVQFTSAVTGKKWTIEEGLFSSEENGVTTHRPFGAIRDLNPEESQRLAQTGKDPKQYLRVEKANQNMPRKYEPALREAAKRDAAFQAQKRTKTDAYNAIDKSAQELGLKPYTPFIGNAPVKPHIQVSTFEHPITNQTYVDVKPSGFDTFKHKDELKKRGFTWDGETWSKRVHSTPKNIKVATEEIRSLPGAPRIEHIQPPGTPHGADTHPLWKNWTPDAN